MRVFRVLWSLALLPLACGACQTVMFAVVRLAVDHSTSHLAYYARITIVLPLQRRVFTAIRYAKITYRTGSVMGQIFTCDGLGDPRCQYQPTSSYFLGLPDGNIAYAILGTDFLVYNFSKITVGEQVYFNGRVYTVLSDAAPLGKDQIDDGGCHWMVADQLSKTYGPTSDGKQGYPVQVTFERLSGKGAFDGIDDMNHFLHGPHCAGLIARASRNVTVRDLS